MAVQDDGKVAITHYRVLNKFNNHMHICVQLETGRTHQIRVPTVLFVYLNKTVGILPIAP